MVNRMLALRMALAVAFLGCAADSNEGEGVPEEEEPFVLPAVVSVRIESAVIRPWDGSNELWDDSQQVTQEEISMLAEILGAPSPYDQVAASIAELAIDHWAPPDAYGFAEVFVDGAWGMRVTIADENDNFDNTFVPTFVDRPGWDGLPLDESLRVAVTLIDEDDLLTGEDDPIGNVVIDYDAIVAAVKAGGVHQVATHSQATGTILFIGISVSG